MLKISLEMLKRPKISLEMQKKCVSPGEAVRGAKA